MRPLISLALTSILATGEHETHRPPSVGSQRLADLAIPSDLLITLERMKCHGSCPSYVVTIDATGDVTWNGREFVDAVGERRAHISSDSVASLVARFDAMRFGELHDDYFVSSNDAPPESSKAVITLRREGVVKRVSVFGADMLRIEGLHKLPRLVAEDANGDRISTADEDVNATQERGLEIRVSLARVFSGLSDLAAGIDELVGRAHWIGRRAR